MSLTVARCGGKFETSAARVRVIDVSSTMLADMLSEHFSILVE